MGGGFLQDSNATDSTDTTIVTDSLQGSGSQGSLLVGTSAVEVKVGSNRLVGRKIITIFHNGSGKLFWGYTSSVTIATGTPIFRNTTLTISAGENTAIYVIANTVGNDVRVTEGS